MALREKVLLKKAEKFELKEIQKIIVNKDQIIILEKLLNDAYLIRKPKPNEYHIRKDLIRVFNEIARELYSNALDIPVVVEFGSFSMDLFTSGSDLDLSVNFRDSPFAFPRDQKIKTLRKFARKFYALQNGGYVRGVLPVMNAKVPILKVIDAGTGVECDLSVENRDGISKSAIIHLITSIDERFQKLSFLMKAWAKAHDINSSKDRTLNSLSIILLVAFHLQTRDPPILPPFSAILKDGEDLATVKKSIKNFQNYGTKNTESLGELFVLFLIKLASVEKLWPKGLCASPYQAHWTSKTWDTKIASMSVEDFTDRTQNVSRAVGKSEVEEIYKCIQVTIKTLGSFMNGEIGESNLKKSLFGSDGPAQHHPRVEPNPNVQPVRTTGPNGAVVAPRAAQNGATRPPPVVHHWGAPQPVDHQSTKRMRGAEGVVPGTQGWTPTWGGPGWGHGWGGAPTGGGSVPWSQETQPTQDHSRRTIQRPHTGTSSPYGPPFR